MLNLSHSEQRVRRFSFPSARSNRYVIFVRFGSMRLYGPPQFYMSYRHGYR